MYEIRQNITALHKQMIRDFLADPLNTEMVNGWLDRIDNETRKIAIRDAGQGYFLLAAFPENGGKYEIIWHGHSLGLLDDPADFTYGDEPEPGEPRKLIREGVRAKNGNHRRPALNLN
jgi:hypothetical protein